MQILRNRPFQYNTLISSRGQVETFHNKPVSGVVEESPPETSVGTPAVAPALTYEEILASGAVPPLMAESLRLVPFESAGGQSFHKLMRNFIEPYYSNPKCSDMLFGQHDFEKNPIRFMLSDVDVSQAYAISKAQPPIVVISKGCFCGSKADIKKTSDLIWNIYHEMAHIKLRQEVSAEATNSKTEEGAFYALPLEFMHLNGIDPREGAEYLKSLAETVRTSLGKDGTWFALLDVHPIPKTMHKIADDMMAAIILKHGHHNYDLDKNPVLDESFKATIGGISHTSYLTARLAGITAYSTFSPDAKVKALKDILLSIPEGSDYPVRFSDIGEELSKIQGPSQKVLEEFLDSVYEQMYKLSNKEFRNDLVALANRTVGLLPSGIPTRFRPIEAAMKKVIKANEAMRTIRSDSEDWSELAGALSSAARALCEAVNKEELSHNRHTRNYLKNFKWPGFEFPDVYMIEQLNERKIDYKSQGKSKEWIAKKIPISKYPTISWQPIRICAKEDEDVLKAAFIMGLGDDYALHEAVQSHADSRLYVAIYKPDDGSEANKFAPIVNTIKSEDGEPLGNLIIKDTSDRTSSRCIGCDREAKHNSQSRLREIVRNSLCALIEDSCKAESGVKFQDAVKTSLSYNSVNMNDYGNSFLLDISSLVEYINPTTFHSIVSYIAQEIRSQVENPLTDRLTLVLKNKFKQLLKNDPDSYIPLIRETFLPQDRDTNDFLVSIGLSLTNNNYPEGIGDGELLYKLGNLTLTNFILNDIPSIFNDREKEKILSYFIYNNSIEQLNEGQIHEENKQDNNMFQMVFELFSRNFPFINDTDSLDKLIQTTDDNKFRSEVYRLKLLNLLNSENISSLEQCLSLSQRFKGSKLFKLDFVKAKFQDFIRQAMNETVSLGDLDTKVNAWLSFNENKLLEDESKYTYLSLIHGKIQEAGLNEQIAYCKSILGRAYIEEPKLRESFLDTLSSAIAKKYGMDDASDVYYNRIKPEFDWVTEQVKVSDQYSLVQKILVGIKSQSKSSEYVKTSLENAFVQKMGDSRVQGISIVSEIFINAKGLNHDFLDFVIHPYSEQSADQYIRSHLKASMSTISILYGEELIDRFMDNYDDNFINCLPSEELLFLKAKQSMFANFELIHQNFWNAPLALRSILIKEALVADSNPANPLAIYNLALDKMLPGGQTDPVKAREINEIKSIIIAYVDSLDPTQRYLALSAMLVASERTTGQADLNIGDALALFLENMGPAETKLGQCAESHPQVPADIRSSLKKLKFKAAEPYRFEVHDWLKQLNNQILDSYNDGLSKEGITDLDEHGRVYIKHVGDVLGSGSLFVAVEVMMSDGSTQVVSIRRRDAYERALYGFKTLEGMLSKLEPGKIKETLSELLLSAKRKLATEVNCQISKDQYGKASELYNATVVDIDGEQIPFSSTMVTAQGEAFYMMQKVEGKHFTEIADDSESVERVKKISMAVLTLELSNILNGVFCNDRHGGNVKVQANNQINHIDFKALSLDQWSQSGYDQFAEILVKVVQDAASIKNADDFVNKFLNLQSEIRERGEVIEPFVSEVQKALLSASEYARQLSPQELQRVILSAIKNGMNDHMKQAISKQVDKLPFWTRSLVNTFLKNGSMPFFSFIPIEIKQNSHRRILNN
jgi:hypothetical protein